MNIRERSRNVYGPPFSGIDYLLRMSRTTVVTTNPFSFDPRCVIIVTLLGDGRSHAARRRKKEVVMTRITSRPRIFVTAVAALVALLLAGTVVLGAAVLKRGGYVNAVNIVTDTDQTGVSQENSWTDISGMSMPMSVPSGEQALFLITFSASVTCEDGQEPVTNYCYIRVLVDGVEASPGAVVFDGAADGNTEYAREANSMQFVAGPISSGAHTIKVQGFIGGSSSSFQLWSRTLSVLRMPAK